MLSPKGSVISVTAVVAGGVGSDKKSIKLLELSLVKLVGPAATLPSTELKLLEDPNLLPPFCGEKEQLTVEI